MLRPNKLLVLGAVLSIGLTSLVITSAWAVTASNGATCTIVGTPGNDVLVGTPAADVICGLGGNDTISGLGGDDFVDGGTGNDVINSGAGNDTVVGGAGADVIVSGTGNDVVNSGTGNDTINSGAGNDTVTAGTGNDAVTAGTGTDVVNGGTGVDVLNGGAGADTLNGAAGADKLIGGTGSDGLIGGTGADVLNGGNQVTDPNERNLCERDALDVVTYCGYDDNAPFVQSVTLDATSVDTSVAAVTIHLTMNVTDGLMGVNWIQCSLMLAGGRNSTGGGNAVRTAGSITNGTWSCDMVLPRGSTQGDYGLGIAVSDKSGNMGYYQQMDSGPWHSDLPAIIDETQTHWISQTGAGDAQAPRITAVSFNHATVNTSAAAQSVVVTSTITDDMSGIDSVQCMAIHGSVQILTGEFKATRVTGDANNGTYHCTLNLPKGAGQGKWTVQISAQDVTGKSYTVLGDKDLANSWIVDDTAIPTAAPPITLAGNNYFTQTGAGDDSNPELTNVSTNVASVDAAAADRHVLVSLSITEVGSGIKSVDLMSMGPNYQQNSSVCTAGTHSGSSYNYTCDLTIPLGAGRGAHYFWVTLVDNVDNFVTYVAGASGTWTLRPFSMYGGGDVSGLSLGTTSVLNQPPA